MTDSDRNRLDAAIARAERAEAERDRCRAGWEAGLFDYFMRQGACLSDALAKAQRVVVGHLASLPDPPAPVPPPADSDDAVRAAAGVIGRKYGHLGGRARAKVLSPERRSEIAKAGAAARWKKMAAPKSEPESEPPPAEAPAS